MKKQQPDQQNIPRIPIAGSERAAVEAAHTIGAAEANESMIVTLMLRRRSEYAGALAKIDLTGNTRKPLSREQFAELHGTDDEDLDRVRAFAKQYGLHVQKTHAAAGMMVLEGSAEAFERAFQVKLSRYKHAGIAYRGHAGAVHIPEPLAEIVLAVLGLDNRPQARPHFRLLLEAGSAARAEAAEHPYDPPEVARLYRYPQVADCSGQHIGIIELGGGYRPDEVSAYCKRLGISPPKLTDVSVQGAGNRPAGNPAGPDGEVALDIEIAAAVAPAVHISVYFAPNTDAGFLDALITAIHDKRSKPSIISVSWGGPEQTWTSQAMHAMNRAMRDAAALGVTVCCASGDSGSTDGLDDGSLHVDFPASSPFALACGGTELLSRGNTIIRETVWNEGASGGASGGGVSRVFQRPPWQAGIHLPNPSASHNGRGVPDVAGNADPVTGYRVLVDGEYIAVGGTSAVAPLWAGLIATLNQALGRPIGFLNPLLYRLPKSATAFHDIVVGSNAIGGAGGAYPAHPGWDACTGLGSPDGIRLMRALQALH